MKPVVSFPQELAKRGLSPEAIARIAALFSRIEVYSDAGGSRFGNTMQYFDFLAALAKNVVTDLESAVRDQIPSIYANLIPWPGYTLLEDGYHLGPIELGKNALYWNGTSVELKTYDAVAERLGEFATVAERALSMKPDTIVDFGSGIGFFSLYLASVAADLRVINIERDPVAAVTSRLLVERFNLQDRITILAADVNVAPSEFWNALKSYAGERNVLTTRAALHPYFSDDQYRMLFRTLSAGINLVGGSHSELNGHSTETFEVLRRKLTGALHVSSDYTAVASDPFRVLKEEGLATKIILEELPAQFLHDRFISRCVWCRD